MPVTAIVLAAGGSSRLGRPKQLLPFRGTTLLHHATAVALEACPRVRVVVSPGLTLGVCAAESLPRAKTVDQALPTNAAGRAGLPVEVVENPDWAEGMASSIRRGLEGVEGSVLITLCDQPLVTSSHLRALISAVSADAPIVATAYRGIVGVPACFAAQFLDELRALRGDRGARAIIEAHGALTIPFEDAGFDVDTAGDARRL